MNFLSWVQLSPENTGSHCSREGNGGKCLVGDGGGLFPETVKKTSIKSLVMHCQCLCVYLETILQQVVQEEPFSRGTSGREVGRLKALEACL